MDSNKRFNSLLVHSSSQLLKERGYKLRRILPLLDHDFLFRKCIKLQSIDGIAYFVIMSGIPFLL